MGGGGRERGEGRGGQKERERSSKVHKRKSWLVLLPS